MYQQLDSSQLNYTDVLFDFLITCSKGGKAFIDTLLPRLNPKNTSGGPSMAFELEVSSIL